MHPSIVFLNAYILGTLRLWRLPDCIPLVFLHSKAFTLLSKQIFYTQLFHAENLELLKNYRDDAMPQEPFLDSSSIINYSIWKMDVASYDSHVYIAFSTHAHRCHSIYLTSLSNMKELNNKQRQLTLDTSYGSIIDYCFPSKELLLSDDICYLYILFDSNTLVKVDIISILNCNETELFAQSDETIQEINNLLASREFHLVDDGMTNNKISDDFIYKQLFKDPINSTENFYCKRKMERIEHQQRKKQASLQDELDNSVCDYV